MRGLLPPEQLKKLASQEGLKKFIDAKRTALEEQIRALMAIDDICDQEGINVTDVSAR